SFLPAAEGGGPGWGRCPGRCGTACEQAGAHRTPPPRPSPDAGEGAKRGSSAGRSLPGTHGPGILRAGGASTKGEVGERRRWGGGRAEKAREREAQLAQGVRAARHTWRDRREPGGPPDPNFVFTDEPPPAPRPNVTDQPPAPP